jgi:hypothetical protein
MKAEAEVDALVSGHTSDSNSVCQISVKLSGGCTVTDLNTHKIDYVACFDLAAAEAMAARITDEVTRARRFCSSSG